MTRAIRISILLLLLVAAAVRGAALVAPGCEESTTTAQMRACLNERYQKVDEELNRAYKDTMSQLDESRRTKLRAAQRAWITFRETSAEFEASAAQGGTLSPLIYLATLISMTEERSKELTAIANSPGDR